MRDGGRGEKHEPETDGQRMEAAIIAEGIAKYYRLGTINRHTLVDEFRYALARLAGKNAVETMGKVAFSPTEQRRYEAERDGRERFWALRDVSFEVREGEVVGIIGRNGAGKSTLLKIISRITEPSEGTITLNGRIGSLLEVGTGFHPELTGRENVYMNGCILGMKKAEIDRKLDEIVAFSGVEKFIDTPVKRYSSGMHVRLAFAVAAHLDPEILVIDEVLAVGDMEFQKKCLGKMQSLSYSGRTILFVSHNMTAINRLCSRAMMLDAGTIVLKGAAHEVTAAYNAAQGQAQGERSWEPAVAPGGEEVRLLAVRSMAADGGMSGTFAANEGVTVEIEYEVRVSGISFRCGINLVANEQVAFMTIEPSERSYAAPMVSLARVSIPPDLLNEGTYAVGVFLFGAKGHKQIKNGYVREHEVIQFQVYEPEGHVTARGDYFKKLPGLVRPRLLWMH